MCLHVFATCKASRVMVAMLGSTSATSGGTHSQSLCLAVTLVDVDESFGSLLGHFLSCSVLLDKSLRLFSFGRRSCEYQKQWFCPRKPILDLGSSLRARLFGAEGISTNRLYTFENTHMIHMINPYMHIHKLNHLCCP